MRPTSFSYMTKSCFIIIGLLFGVPATWARLAVVVTTPDIAAIAQEVGGDEIELTTLAKPTEDPHFVDARPSFIAKLNRADVLIEGGAELEVAWLGPLVDGARNAKIRPGGPGYIKANEGIAMLEVPSQLDRSKGDIHAAGNPHYLVDPANGQILARHIATAFAALDPKSAVAYEAHLKAFLAKLEPKLTEWEATFAPYKGQQFVAYHNSWPYFAKRFGLESRLFLEPKPGVPPTPGHLAEVILSMRQDHVHVILVDPYLNRRTAEAVAAKTSASVVDVAQFPGGVKGTEGGYIPLLDYLVTSVSRALKGKE
jgi:zinc/manganese transport system substrate-binding protein